MKIVIAAASGNIGRRTAEKVIQSGAETVLLSRNPEKLADGSVTWFGFNADITARKKSEDILKQSEEKFSKMLLAGRASMEAITRDSYGRATPRNLVLVAVHDHKMRFMGHHCIVERIFDDEPGPFARSSSIIGFVKSRRTFKFLRFYYSNSVR